MSSNYLCLSEDKLNLHYMIHLKKVFKPGLDLLESIGATIISQKKEKESDGADTLRLTIILPYTISGVDFTNIGGQIGRIPGAIICAYEFTKVCQIIKNNCPVAEINASRSCVI